MYFGVNNETLQRYLAKVSLKSILSFGRNKDILNAILAYFNIKGYDYSESYKRQNELYHVLWRKDTNNMSDIFSGSEYKVLVTLLGSEWAEKFKKVWDRSSDYIYSTGAGRRSFRTKTHDVLYLSTGVSKLLELVKLAADEFTYEKYFFAKDNTYSYSLVIPDLLALEIDEGNEAIANRIKEIIYGDNNTGLVTREIIKGLLMSHNSEAHKWVGELLLAARLQEGLRQTIVECMDEGSKDGFLYILKIILDNDLIRFSSVVRALDVWAGLGISAQKPAVVKKCLETGYRCLTDSCYAEEGLKSSDAMLIYMSLWSLAFDEVMATESRIKTLLSSDDKYKRMAALCFLKQTQFPRYQHRLAAPLLDDTDYEVKCWVLDNLYADMNYLSIRSENRDELAKFKRMEGVCGTEELFYKLKDMLDNMPRKEVVFKESVFPWWQAAVTCDGIIVKMLLTFADNPTDNYVDIMLDYRDKMSADTRSQFLYTFLYNPKTKAQKTAIVELMGDKSSNVRAAALKIVENLKLSTDDYKIIEDLLQYKAGDLRKNAISMLLRQPSKDLLESIRRLFESKNENKILAALDIATAVENDSKFAGISQACRNIAVQYSDISQKTKVLADKIVKNDINNYSAAGGFGLFDPKQEIQIPEISNSKGFLIKDVFSSGMEDIKRTLLSLSSLIDRYKDFEYEAEDWNGAFVKVVLGGEHNFRTIRNRTGKYSALTLDNYPLPEVWRGAASEYGLTAQKLLEILFYYNINQHDIFSDIQEWFKTLISELFPIRMKEFDKFIKDIPFAAHIRSIFIALLNECSKTEIFQMCYDMSCYIYCRTPLRRFTEEYEKRDKHVYYYPGYKSCLVDAKEMSFWLRHMRESIYDDQSFRKGFCSGYAYYKASGYKSHGCLQLEDFEKAFALGLVDDNELYTELCGRPLSCENLRSLTDDGIYNHKNVSSCKKLYEICKRVSDRIVSIELKRGDMTTEVSHLTAGIYKFAGARFFAGILVGAEKDTYVRGYNFVGDDSTKKQIFSHLLKCCYPDDGEDENTLRELLKDKKVTDKQLIDAAMYSPQWLDIVEKYLNWPGLKSACWYFHAHVNEVFSHDKETIVARFSPVSPLDFKNGAFDINWFNDAYYTIGEKRFKVVYDSAKYIAGGGLHKRAQLFSDAALGKLDVKQVEKVIKEKRNKDYVLCYGLISLGKDKNEALNRYEFLHGFLKESKQFGAQRRESEAKAVAIALENLARNAGFSDISRFTWYMETEKIRSIGKYLKPAPVEDVEVCISIDELGRAVLNAVKEGKQLKDIPSRLKNNEYIKEIKAILKSLKAQYSRACASLEKAMESEDEFTADELVNLLENPVIYPLIQNLVLKCGDRLGYFKDNMLVDIQNRKTDLKAEDKLIIAHPVHLYKSGEWPAYQKDIYERRIVQPFKQVFRELYKPNADELQARTLSNRYDGHQIQPGKAAALLKGRGWTASYDEGLQKVYYKENIIAQIYAMADWFSPADIEAPTIEGVVFFDRKTGKAVPFINVQEIIFSEIMRDVDLVVSVAHVGGVDPEASLSTIEMRTVIITEMLRLLKLGNVKLKGSHAFIDGSLGQYTVHLGSGIVHKMASGALNILPVHSQHRGRIFLPFVDDDPKTAEVISKITFLAEDSKIKDPTILIQIAN